MTVGFPPVQDPREFWHPLMGLEPARLDDFRPRELALLIAHLENANGA